MNSDPDANIDWYDADVRKGRPVSRIPYKTITIALAAASLVFALDLSLPLGVAAGVLYVALILIGLWFPKPQHIYALAALASVLTIIGYIASPSGSDLWVVLINRGLALFAIWITALLVATRKQLENSIRLSRDNLEVAVTERTMELLESEERLAMVLEGSQQGFWDWNIETDKVQRNDRWAEILGYSSIKEFEANTDSWTDNIHPDDRDAAWASINDHLEGRSPIHQLEYRMLTKSGGVKWIRDQAKIVRRDDNGRPLRMCGTHTDITERKALEENLRQSQKMEAVGHLAGGIAHDFNNLMGVMIGNAEMLREQVGDNEKARRSADAIIRSVQRGASLTQRILAFSRQQVLSPQSTVMDDLVLGLEDMLHRTLGETVELRSELGSGTSKALIDPHQFEDVLINLAINARDAMPKGGVLAIRTADVTLDKDHVAQYEDVTPGDYVKVTVSDTGIGMSPETVEKAFEPFFTTKEVGEGSGLGLSMVYGFAKQSNGHVTITSELGHGTVIDLYLPKSGQVRDGTVPRNETPEPARGSERVLIVEDDEALRDIPVTMLLEQGYEVVEAGDGKEAIKYLQKGQPFDLLFTDVVLPGGMNGMEIASEAKLMQPGIKALFTSGYAEPAVTHNGKLDRDVILINKPYLRATLLEKVRAVLDGTND